MYDKGKIIGGLIIFVAIFSFPLIYNKLGKASDFKEPELSQKAKEAKHCVEPKAYMRANHMQLLDEWRDLVVRENKKTYDSKEYKVKYNMSLQNTCMDCHTNKRQFCDQCHNYVNAKPYCWDCHLDPYQEK